MKNTLKALGLVVLMYIGEYILSFIVGNLEIGSLMFDIFLFVDRVYLLFLIPYSVVFYYGLSSKGIISNILGILIEITGIMVILTEWPYVNGVWKIFIVISIISSVLLLIYSLFDKYKNKQ